MRRLRWTTVLLAILAVAGAVAGTAMLLPDDPYQRYATLDHTIQNRIRWIYERIHFDPTPIDVVVIGSSRTGAAVDSPRLEADLATRGLALHTVNFSLPESGRDLNWVLLQEVLTTKSPRLIVIGVTEKPSRFGHPAYKYVAPAADIVDPAYVGNLNYLESLIYLPYRQLRLTAARLAPDLFRLPTRFDPARYPGSNDDTTVSFTAGDGTVVDRDRIVSAADLAAGKVRYERGVHPPLLGPAWRDIEFGDDRVYLARMIRLAHEHGAKVVFLFLPYYTGPYEIQERHYYERFAPIVDASFVATHDEWFSDVAHLNHAGALMLTDWLAPQVAALATDPPR